MAASSAPPGRAASSASRSSATTAARSGPPGGQAVQRGAQRQLSPEGVGGGVPHPAAERHRPARGAAHEVGAARAGLALHDQQGSATLRTPAHPLPQLLTLLLPPDRTSAIPSGHVAPVTGSDAGGPSEPRRLVSGR
ncbi:hypothetical protein ACFY0G_08200 [Streptomyces sp. NPDC001552]|uniref:hypothetical protein n=1 Tax=Streptomyces sp. NPDC001552 TaxID=3364587 RepID=UPI00367EF45F